MTKDDIVHLGKLSRLKLSPEEIDHFTSEIDAILEYVSTLEGIVSEAAPEAKVGPRCNVWRNDEVTNEPGKYSETIIKAFPNASGRYLEVPKIISQD